MTLTNQQLHDLESEARNHWRAGRLKEAREAYRLIGRSAGVMARPQNLALQASAALTWSLEILDGPPIFPAKEARDAG